MENQGAYRKAQRRVDAKLEFYGHLGAYILVNALLIVINLSTSPDYLWCTWVVFGWGIGLIAHMLKVFAAIDGSDLKKRMVEKEMQKEAAGKNRTYS